LFKAHGKLVFLKELSSPRGFVKLDKNINYA